MKTAVVTGGASGIGRGIAERLRSDGFHVATLDLNPPAEDDLAFRADVTDPEQVAAAVDAIRGRIGPVTVLVNSAGLDGFKRFRNLSFAEWQRVIEVNLHGVRIAGEGGEAAQHSGIVAGDDVVGAVGEPLAELPAADHAGEVRDDPERAALPDVVPEMGGVAGQHHPAPRRRDPYHLHAAGMAADKVEGDAGRDLRLAVVKGDATVEDMADGRDDVLDVEDEVHRAVAHAATGAPGHLGVLEMEAGLRELGPVAGMVPVHVAEDDVLDRVRVDAGRPKRIERRAQPLPAAAVAARPVEAGVEEDRAALAADRPDVEVERHRRGVVLGEDEHVALGALGKVGVAERKDLVGRVGHGISSMGAFITG